MKYLEYKTVMGQDSVELEIKKSTFIGHIKECKTEGDALDFIEEINKANRQATHNCYAYIIGDKKLTQRYSDDGEPQGTAGIPMLEVLKKEDLTNLCVVVTRYFGGVKLGASGLIRAYSKATSSAIEKISIVEMLNFKKISLEFDYSLLGKIENHIMVNGYAEIDRQYTDKVSIILYISDSAYDGFKENLIQMTSSNINIEVMDELLLPIKNNKIIGV